MILASIVKESQLTSLWWLRHKSNFQISNMQIIGQVDVNSPPTNLFICLVWWWEGRVRPTIVLKHCFSLYRNSTVSLNLLNKTLTKENYITSSVKCIERSRPFSLKEIKEMYFKSGLFLIISVLFLINSVIDVTAPIVPEQRAANRLGWMRIKS